VTGLADYTTLGLGGPARSFVAASTASELTAAVAAADAAAEPVLLIGGGSNLVIADDGFPGTVIHLNARGISYAEAEGIKVGMPAEVQSNLEALVLPLGRELRASIDFFEHQQDKAVTQVYVSGGSARSEFIMQLLQTELMAVLKQLSLKEQRRLLRTLTPDELEVMRLRYGLKLPEGMPNRMDRLIRKTLKRGGN